MDMCAELTASRQQQLVDFLDLARPSAHRFAQRLGLPTADADDALQDFVARLLRQPGLIDRYQYPQKLVSVRRRLINEAYRAHRHIGLDEALELSNGHLFLVSSDPILRLAADESLKQLRQLATHRERRILDLVAEDRTVRDVADAVGVTVQAVHNAVYRLRRRWWSVFGSNGTASKSPSRRDKRPAPKTRTRTSA